MNNLPFELFWGVDIAVKKLRPGADFQLEGTNFTIWNDPSGSNPPSWEEVMAQITADQQAAEEWQKNNT
jgi:hypothetical protein